MQAPQWAFLPPCSLLISSHSVPCCREGSTGRSGVVGGGGGGDGAYAAPRIPRRARRVAGDEQRDLLDAANEGLAVARAASAQDGAVEAAERAAAELEERKATKRAAMEAAEGALSGHCSACGGSGIEWSCSSCDAEGFILNEQDRIWRTCEKCEGRGIMPCQICSPEDPDEVICRPSVA